MTHKGTITLETQRLILRRFTLDDADSMFNNWASDPEVTEFLIWPPYESVDGVRERIKIWLAEYEKEDEYIWAIVHKDLNGPIGSIGAVHKNKGTDMVHIGYCIGKNFWKKGYTSEALSELVRFFFEEIGVKCIQSRHDPRNPNSGKVMQKAGMKFEGILRQSDTNNKGICDAAYYSILKDEYFLLKNQM